MPDLINEGNLGLIKAAKRFDETRGIKFISYAVWWIRQSILQALAEQSRIVRLPLNKIGSINKINKAYAILEQKFERPPTAEEISELVELSITEVQQSLKNTGRHISMDAPLIEGEDSSLYDVMGSEDSPNPDASLMLESLREEIRRALETLSPREADVVSSYFGLNAGHAMTLEEIGEKFDVSNNQPECYVSLPIEEFLVVCYLVKPDSGEGSQKDGNDQHRKKDNPNEIFFRSRSAHPYFLLRNSYAIFAQFLSGFICEDLYVAKYVFVNWDICYFTL